MTLAIKPTFSESWYRVKDLKVRLRPAAQISRQFYRGDRWYVVRDPAGNQYHRLSDAAYRFVALLDGRRTVGEAWETVGGQLADDAPTQPDVINIMSQLWAANLIEANVTPDASVLLRRHQMHRKRDMQQKLMSFMFPRIRLWDPDRFLKRWMPVVGKFLSPLGAILWVLMVVTALALVLPHADSLKSFTTATLAPGNWLWLGAVFILTKVIHELGHAFACRRFGGECHELGIMLLVLMPTPYVDASSAWAFPNKWKRVFVGAAGMIFELAFASILALVWLATKDSPNALLPQLAFNGMMVASVSTLIFNANPLLRYDGYYILSDILEIPNLQQKSTEYALGLIKRHLFRVKSQFPLPPAGQRVLLLVYAITSTIYRVFIGIIIILMVGTQIPIIGVVMAIGGIITWLFMPIIKASRYLLLSPELNRKRGPAIAISLGFVTLVLLMIGVIRFPVHYRAVGILEADQKATLVIETSGFVTTIGTDPATQRQLTSGARVTKGQLILEARDEALESEIYRLQAQMDALSARKMQSQVTDPVQAQIDDLEMAAVGSKLDDALRRQEMLVLRAPFDGLLTAPHLQDLPGRYVQRGTEIGRVEQVDKLVALTVLEQTDAQLASMNEHIDPHPEVRLAGALQTTLLGYNTRLLPQATDRLPHPSLGHPGGGAIPVSQKDPNKATVKFSEVRVSLDNPEHLYIPGQRVYVRFNLGEKRPLIWQWTIRLKQLLQKNKHQQM